MGNVCYDISQAPAEQLLQFHEQFYQVKEIKKLLEKKELFSRRRDYASLMMVNQEIEKRRIQAYAKYVKELEVSGYEVDIRSLGLPQEELDKLYVHYITVFIACDLIESAVMDMNDVVKRHHAKLSVEKFNDLLKLLRNVKKKLSTFDKDSGYLGPNIWAERCDDMYQMIQSKAKKIYIKNKSQENPEKVL